MIETKVVGVNKVRDRLERLHEMFGKKYARHFRTGFEKALKPYVDSIHGEILRYGHVETANLYREGVGTKKLKGLYALGGQIHTRNSSHLHLVEEGTKERFHKNGKSVGKMWGGIGGQMRPTSPGEGGKIRSDLFTKNTKKFIPIVQGNAESIVVKHVIKEVKASKLSKK